MIIGVPKEIKTREYRVGLVPSGVRELVANGHDVIVQTQAGIGIGIQDDAYVTAGARIAPTADQVFQEADLIVKVKEPQPEECAKLREGQVLFTFLHLAPDPVQAQGLMKSGCIAIAYESVTDERGRLPLLSPMSEVAGRMSVQVGAYALQIASGGSGVLLGGVPGVEAAHVTVIGGGVVGTNAARMALGLGAHVTIVDRSIARLQELDHMFGTRLQTLYSTLDTLESAVIKSDLVIGAVLLPGAASAPKLVTRQMISHMRPGSVIVDVAIDQGGCMETSRATTHDDPTYVVDGVVHYCVANMPGAVARTSTFALNNATLPYVLELANRGYKEAFVRNPYLMEGLTVYRGVITNAAAAHDLGQPFTSAIQALANTQ